MPLGMTVLDTLSRSIPGGDENTGPDMSMVIAAADRIRNEFDSATTVVHHSGKTAGKGARGHTSLTAAADVVLSAVERCATIEKSRDGITGEQFPFDLRVIELGRDDEGDPITTCIVQPTDRPPKPRAARAFSGAAKTALKA
jgi:RecA-family ATPase